MSLDRRSFLARAAALLGGGLAAKVIPTAPEAQKAGVPQPMNGTIIGDYMTTVKPSGRVTYDITINGLPAEFHPDSLRADIYFDATTGRVRGVSS